MSDKIIKILSLIIAHAYRLFHCSKIATKAIILSLIIAHAYRLFHCSKIATKAIPAATERIQALKNLGFERSAEKLIGHDGTEYDSYFVLNS